MSVFGRIRESLTRTKQQIVDRFEEIVRRADEPERRSRPVDVDTIDALEELLDLRRHRRRGDRPHHRGRESAVAERRKPARPGEAGDPRGLRVRRSADRGRGPSAGHADCRRQRHRQDDDGRQARQPAEAIGPAAAHLRGRHVSRRGRRAARNLGRTRGRRHGARARGSRPGRRRVRCDRLRQGEGARPGPRRHRRPAAHARQPDERARQDPAHRGARSRRARRRKCCSCSTPRSGRTA